MDKVLVMGWVVWKNMVEYLVFVDVLDLVGEGGYFVIFCIDVGEMKNDCRNIVLFVVYYFFGCYFGFWVGLFGCQFGCFVDWQVGFGWCMNQYGVGVDELFDFEIL